MYLPDLLTFLLEVEPTEGWYAFRAWADGIAKMFKNPTQSDVLFLVTIVYLACIVVLSTRLKEFIFISFPFIAVHYATALSLVLLVYLADFGDLMNPFGIYGKYSNSKSANFRSFATIVSICGLLYLIAITVVMAIKEKAAKDS